MEIDKIFIVDKVITVTWRRSLSSLIKEGTLVKVTPKGKRITTANGNTFIYLDKSYEFFDTYADAVAYVRSQAENMGDELMKRSQKLAEIVAECDGLINDNATLREAIVAHSNCVRECPVCGYTDPCSTDDVCLALNETSRTAMAQVIRNAAEWAADTMDQQGDAVMALEQVEEYANRWEKGEAL